MEWQLKPNVWSKTNKKIDSNIFAHHNRQFPHYRLIFYLGKKSILPGKSKLKLVKLQSLVAKCCKIRKYIALQTLQILYTFVLHAEIATIFGPNVVAISARNTKVYKICKAIFSAFYNISQPNFAILLILVCSFQKYTFFAKIKN